MEPREPVLELPPGPGRKEPPLPADPAQHPALAPMVYVHERLEWEYKVVSRPVSALLNEDALNALGKDGWELSCSVAVGSDVQFFFKRTKS